MDTIVNSWCYSLLYSNFELTCINEFDTKFEIPTGIQSGDFGEVGLDRTEGEKSQAC
jgi:hypothetical protein